MRRNGWNVKVLLLSPIHDPLNVASLLMNGAGIWGRSATREGVTTKVNNAYSGTLPRAAVAYLEANTESKKIIRIKETDKLEVTGTLGLYSKCI